MRIFFCILIFFVWSCNNKTDVPSGVLPVKQMQNVFWDMVRADMMVNNQYTKDSSINKFEASTNLYQQIFKMHHTTKEAFKQSIQYYQTRPDLLQPIFDSLYTKGSGFPRLNPSPALK